MEKLFSRGGSSLSQKGEMLGLARRVDGKRPGDDLIGTDGCCLFCVCKGGDQQSAALGRLTAPLQLDCSINMAPEQDKISEAQRNVT